MRPSSKYTGSVDNLAYINYNYIMESKYDFWKRGVCIIVLKWDVNNGGGDVEVDYSVTKLTETTYKFSFIGTSNYPIKVELSEDGSSIPHFDDWLSPS